MNTLVPSSNIFPQSNTSITKNIGNDLCVQSNIVNYIHYGKEGIANVAQVSKDKSASNNPSIGGEPFSTIGDAIEAIVKTNSKGITILLHPGVYEECIVIPDDTNLDALCPYSSVVTQSSIESTTDIVTMGNNCKVTGIAIVGTLSLHVAPYSIVRGVVFPGKTSTLSKLKHCTIALRSLETTKSEYMHMYCIHFEGGGAPSDGYIVVQGVVASCTTTGHESIAKGLYVSGPSTVTVRESNFMATSLYQSIGAEVCHEDASLVMRVTHLSGETADVSQTKGLLTLGSTTLAHSNANGLDFVLASMCYIYTACYQGKLLHQKGWLFPGSTTLLEEMDPSVAPRIYIAAPSIAKRLHVSASKAPGKNGSVKVDMYRNGSIALSCTLHEYSLAAVQITSTTLCVNDSISFFVSGTGDAENIVVQVQIV